MSSALEHAVGTNSCKCIVYVYMVRLLDRRMMSEFVRGLPQEHCSSSFVQIL